MCGFIETVGRGGEEEEDDEEAASSPQEEEGVMEAMVPLEVKVVLL
jgi:hypothetical protein